MKAVLKYVLTEHGEQFVEAISSTGVLKMQQLSVVNLDINKMVMGVNS